MLLSKISYTCFICSLVFRWAKYCDEAELRLCVSIWNLFWKNDPFSLLARICSALMIFCNSTLNWSFLNLLSIFAEISHWYKRFKFRMFFKISLIYRWLKITFAAFARFFDFPYHVKFFSWKLTKLTPTKKCSKYFALSLEKKTWNWLEKKTWN